MNDKEIQSSKDHVLDSFEDLVSQLIADKEYVEEELNDERSAVRSLETDVDDWEEKWEEIKDFTKQISHHISNLSTLQIQINAASPNTELWRELRKDYFSAVHAIVRAVVTHEQFTEGIADDIPLNTLSEEAINV